MYILLDALLKRLQMYDISMLWAKTKRKGGTGMCREKKKKKKRESK